MLVAMHLHHSLLALENVAQCHSLFHVIITARGVAQAVNHPSVTVEAWVRSHTGCVMDGDELRQDVLIRVLQSSPCQYHPTSDLYSFFHLLFTLCDLRN
jgi:hypothetical protein